MRIEDMLNTVICGDALEVLREMPDKSVDVILTDPPYKDEDVPGPYYEWWQPHFKEMCRVARAYVIFFNNAKRMYGLFQCCGEPRRIAIWYKPWTRYNCRWEPILIYDVGADWNIGTLMWTDGLSFNPLHRGQSVHVYEKPQGLMNRLLSFIPSGKSICDPFGGSGTTGRAAKRAGNPFLLIEHNPEYCELARRRLAEIPPNLFENQETIGVDDAGGVAEDIQGGLEDGII